MECIYLDKLLGGFIFNCTLQRSPFTRVFLAFSWPVVIIPSGLWQASYRTHRRRSYVVAVLTEILRLGESHPATHNPTKKLSLKKGTTYTYVRWVSIQNEEASAH